MQDIKDVIKSSRKRIRQRHSILAILKDFERVLDELDLYVYDNWENGELAAGPEILRHFITQQHLCGQEKKMPDSDGGKRLTDYGCKVFYKKDVYIHPKKSIKTR